MVEEIKDIFLDSDLSEMAQEAIENEQIDSH